MKSLEKDSRFRFSNGSASISQKSEKSLANQTRHMNRHHKHKHHDGNALKPTSWPFDRLDPNGRSPLDNHMKKLARLQRGEDEKGEDNEDDNNKEEEKQMESGSDEGVSEEKANGREHMVPSLREEEEEEEEEEETVGAREQLARFVNHTHAESDQQYLKSMNAAYRDVYQRANNSLFRYLDEYHIGVTDLQDEHFLYNASDVLIQDTLSVPVVINVPDSEVNYEFNLTHAGEIAYAIVLATFNEGGDQSSDNEVEPEMEFHTIKPSKLVHFVGEEPEPIRGSFMLDDVGILYFFFDNQFDWTSTKNMSYTVEVFSPTFTQPDEERVELALPMLRELDIDTVNCQERLENALATIKDFEEIVTDLAVEIDEITNRIEELEDEYDDLEDAEEEDLELLQNSYDVLPGLSIRLLGKDTLLKVLEYVPEEGRSVCTYWRDIVDGTNKYSDPNVYEEHHSRIWQSNKDLGALPLPGRAVPPTRTNRMMPHEKHILPGASMAAAPPTPTLIETNERTANDKPRAKPPRRAYPGAMRPTRTIVVEESKSRREVSGGESEKTPHREVSVDDYSADQFAAIYGSGGGGQDNRHMRLQESDPSYDYMSLSTTNTIKSAKKAVDPTAGLQRHHHADALLTKSKHTPSKEEVKDIASYQPKQESRFKSFVSGMQGVFGANNNNDMKKDDSDMSDNESLDGVLYQHDTKTSKRDHTNKEAVLKLIDTSFRKDRQFDQDKTAIKMKLTNFCKSFEKKRGRQPSIQEKRKFNIDLYKRYSELQVEQASNHEHINHLLASINLTFESYKQKILK